MRGSKDLALVAVALAALFPLAAPCGDQSVTVLTAYSGNPKCDPGSGGGNQSVTGPRPLDHTWENPGDGWAMAAVCGSEFQKMKGCAGKVKGKTIKVMDICPACCKEGGLRHIDISHACKGDTMRATIEWDPACKGIDQKGQHPAAATRN